MCEHCIDCFFRDEDGDREQCIFDLENPVEINYSDPACQHFELSESAAAERRKAPGELTFSANTWPLKRWGLTIEEEKNSVICEIRDERKVKTAHSVNLVDNWAKLQSLLAKCNFSAWREQYERPALDGTHWHLEIQYADGRTMESNGLNDYPDEWRDFMAVWRYCKRITEIASMR